MLKKMDSVEMEAVIGGAAKKAEPAPKKDNGTVDGKICWHRGSDEICISGRKKL